MVDSVIIDPPGAGSVSFTTAPVVDGTDIIFTATPNEGYIFNYFKYKARYKYADDDWQPTEGTDLANPYTFTEYTDSGRYHYYITLDEVTAYFVRDPSAQSAINLSLVSHPAGVGDLTGGGLRTGTVGSSVSYNVNAEVAAASQARYHFLYWLDDEGVKHNTKGFTKSFTLKSGYTTANPERKTFVAYFGTGLIIRSASSGDILRGSSGGILRDE